MSVKGVVPAHPGSLGKRAVKRVCVCVSVKVIPTVSFTLTLHT